MTLKQNILLDLRSERDKIMELETINEQIVDDSYNYIVDTLETRFTTEKDDSLGLHELVHIVNLLDDLDYSWTDSLSFAIEYIEYDYNKKGA